MEELGRAVRGCGYMARLFVHGRRFEGFEGFEGLDPLKSINIYKVKDI